MDLFILRHAIAVPRGTVGYEVDERRPLTDRGRERMAETARGMRACGVRFDAILSSPVLRALATARIVAEVYGFRGPIDETVHLAPEGSPRELIAYINQTYRQDKRLLLTGHEPYLSALTSKLLTNRADLPIIYKKGGLCRLAVVGELTYGACANMSWFVPPRFFRKLAD